MTEYFLVPDESPLRMALPTQGGIGARKATMEILKTTVTDFVAASGAAVTIVHEMWISPGLQIETDEATIDKIAKLPGVDVVWRPHHRPARD